MTSFHFSIGNSSEGPIGFCARVKADEEEEALDLLTMFIEGLNRQLAASVSFEEGPAEDRGGIEYLEVYFNPEKITVKDIDDETEDDEEKGEEGEEDGHTE